VGAASFGCDKRYYHNLLERLLTQKVLKKGRVARMHRDTV
jgi:hypothetical protein